MKEPSIEEQLKDARAEKAENGALGDGRNLVVYYEDAIKALIQSERRKAAIEARLDEINILPFLGTPYGTEAFGLERLFRDNRIAKLMREYNTEKEKQS